MIKYFFIVFLLSFTCCLQAQELKSKDSSFIFVAIDAYNKPKGGMFKFKERWVDYLIELNRSGKLDKNSYSGEVLNLTVSRYGVLSIESILNKERIFTDFVTAEKRWSLGIQSGRPMPLQLKLKIPKELFEEVKKDKLLLLEGLILEKR